MVLEICVKVDACPCPEESHNPWCIDFVIIGAHCIVSQSPQEEIMDIHGDTVNDVEEDILHEADNIFFIVMAFDWREHIAENAVDRPGCVLELMDEELVLEGLPAAKGFMRTSIIPFGSSRSP